jgi:hypothetical protein
MGGQDIAGKPDQMIAVPGDIGDDSAGLGEAGCRPRGGKADWVGRPPMRHG